jgi:hypothetical protein
MDAELEALLKDFDAFMEARGGSEEEQLFGIYQSGLESLAITRRLNVETLDLAVRRKYWRWVKANARTTTLPPQA